MQTYLNNQFEELSAGVLKLKEKTPELLKVAKTCVQSIQQGNKVIFCGNGGSAAQSQHLAAELVGRYKLERAAMNAVSLTTDTSNITAIGNDYGYDVIFSRQLEGIGKKGDILIGLSTSGNSKNVVLAFEQAKKMGIQTVAFVGNKGGKMQNFADYTLAVPAETSAHIQEMHITLGHLLCDLIEREIHA
ncbi:MAG: D-sedoheptulose 7-phosphate isomerase [Alphaproteobacteria bacterium]|nr:D-sedoheptulose 7-phosphate isomerase [Alphaproteobacteria bacterium]